MAVVYPAIKIIYSFGQSYLHLFLCIAPSLVHVLKLFHRSSFFNADASRSATIRAVNEHCTIPLQQFWSPRRLVLCNNCTILTTWERPTTSSGMWSPNPGIKRSNLASFQPHMSTGCCQRVTIANLIYPILVQ